MKRCAVALLAVRIGTDEDDIFFSAEARPSGYLVRSAPEASARNSRLRDIAKRMRVAASGVSMARISPAIKMTAPVLFDLSLLFQMPLRRAISDMRATNP